jgi:hypothetical protein
MGRWADIFYNGSEGEKGKQGPNLNACTRSINLDGDWFLQSGTGAIMEVGSLRPI